MINKIFDSIYSDSMLSVLGIITILSIGGIVVILFS